MRAAACAMAVVLLGCSSDGWPNKPTAGADVSVAPADVSAPTMDVLAPPDDQTVTPVPDVVAPDVRADVARPSDDGMVIAPPDTMSSGPCFGRRGDSCCASPAQCMPGLVCRSGTCQLINDPSLCAGPGLEHRGCDPMTTTLTCCDGLLCQRSRGQTNGDLLCCGLQYTRCSVEADCCSQLLCVDGLCHCTMGRCLTNDDCCSGHCDRPTSAYGSCA